MDAGDSPAFLQPFPHYRGGRKCSPRMPASPSCVFFLANERVSSTASVSNHGQVCFLTGVAHLGEAGAPLISLRFEVPSCPLISARFEIWAF